MTKEKLISLCLVLPLFLLISAEPKERSCREIRVLVGTIDQAISIEGAGLKMASGGRKKPSGPSQKIDLELKNGKLLLKGKDIGPSVKITADGPISIKGKSYAGSISLQKSGDKFVIVNYLDLEDYLQGVVKNEMSAKWPMEALKSQTVLARTYAAQKIQKPRTDFYDLAATVDDQVYSGYGDKDPAIDQAIKETSGEVLYFESGLAEVFYHSCCGGQTEAAEYVWAAVGRPYLKSIKCAFCQECPYYFWRFPEKGSANGALFAGELGYDGEEVEDMTVKELSPSNHVLKVTVKFKGGHTTEISGSDFRVRMGRDGVRSTLFKVQKEPDGFVIFGSGSGHGVGLCQWGARGMADQNKTYREILDFYFPGTTIKKIY
jgi:stage II sporulation protein D